KMLAGRSPRMAHDGEQVLGLAVAIVVRALRLAHAAEVRAPAGEALGDERAGDRLHHLVVAGAAVERMGMRDDGDAAHGPGGRVVRGRDAAGGAGDGHRLGGGVHSSRKRATGSPPARCDSTISSMSCRSKTRYQTPSG